MANVDASLQGIELLAIEVVDSFHLRSCGLDMANPRLCFKDCTHHGCPFNKEGCGRHDVAIVDQKLRELMIGCRGGFDSDFGALPHGFEIFGGERVATVVFKHDSAIIGLFHRHGICFDTGIGLPAEFAFFHFFQLLGNPCFATCISSVLLGEHVAMAHEGCVAVDVEFATALHLVVAIGERGNKLLHGLALNGIASTHQHGKRLATGEVESLEPVALAAQSAQIGKVFHVEFGEQVVATGN